MAKPTPRVKSGIGGFGPSMTQQHPAHDANINIIMSRHARLPAGSPIGNAPPQQQQYFDMTLLPQTLHDAQNLVIDTRHRFAALPSRVRGRFANDPVQLYRFIQDPRNHDEAVRLGLIPPAAPGSRGDAPPDPSPRVRQQDLVDEAEASQEPARAPKPHAKGRAPA